MSTSTSGSEDPPELEQAVAEADIPALLAALAYTTGDLSLLREDLRPDPAQLIISTAGLSVEQITEASELATKALRRYLSGGAIPAPAPDDGALGAMLTFLVGGSDMDEYLPLFREELAANGEDLRAPSWKLSEEVAGSGFEVLVIGAGMSGIVMGYRLQQAGIPYVVVDKNPELGGTWYENTYPGCRVDVPNHLYSFSFEQRHDWPEHYSTQPVLLDYFQHTAKQLGVVDHVRLSTEVLSATFDENGGMWRVTVRSSEGREEQIVVRAIVSAVGQLNRPAYPDIPGRETFTGPAFHSAGWRRDVDLAGKRVAVIGTGASAVQFAPAIADEAGELLVFQRTATWLAPTPDYRQPVSEATQWLLRTLPSYAEWYRFWLFWKNAESMLPLVTADPSYDDGGRAVSPFNAGLRMMLEAHLQEHLAGHPGLMEKLTPGYAPGAKRIVRDDGTWPRLFLRDNVHLVTSGIEEMTPSGIRTADGVGHEVDVVIYGTGFQASDFLAPMGIYGRDGVEIHDRWSGDARAYLGVTVPGYPNLFCLYGPNTNIVINGSIIYFSECGASYVLECLRALAESGNSCMEVRPEVHDRYNAWIDEGNARMAWGASNVPSWYKNSLGRVSQNWPYSLLEYWRCTREVHVEDYVWK